MNAKTNKPKRLTVTLTFSGMEERTRAELALLNHGLATTSEPRHPRLFFNQLSQAEAARIHRVLMACGINYEAHIKGLERPSQAKFSHTVWDDVALPKGQYFSIGGTRLFGGDRRGRPPQNQKH